MVDRFLDTPVLISFILFVLFLLVRFIMDKRGLLSQPTEKRESKAPDAHEEMQDMIRDDISNTFVHPGTALDYYHLVDNGIDGNKHNE